MKFKLSIFYLLFSLVSAPLSAQGNDRVSINIDVIALGDKMEGLSIKSENKQKQITAEAFTYSKSFRYNGPRLLEIHQVVSAKVLQERQEKASKEEVGDAIPPLPPLTNEKERADQEWRDEELVKRRKKNPTLVSLIRLPLNSKQITILLLPSDKGTYQGYIINEDVSDRPLAKVKVHNLSPYTIGMRLVGEEKKELQSREMMLMESKRGRIVYQLSYQLSHESKKEWKIQESNIIPVNEKEQTQLVFLRSGHQYFRSSGGGAGGFLQMIQLKRRK